MILLNGELAYELQFQSLRLKCVDERIGRILDSVAELNLVDCRSLRGVGG